MRVSKKEYKKLLSQLNQEDELELKDEPKKKKRKKKRSMANKGRDLEDQIKATNDFYKREGRALVQKISTPWTVIRRGNKIVNAFPQGKSTLDFRGTIKPGIPVSFDCKQTTEEKGLPLANIQEHQIEFMREALRVGEQSFILCQIKTDIRNREYFIPGKQVLDTWDTWQKNKGRVGFNTILVEDMELIKHNEQGYTDYIYNLEKHIEKEQKKVTKKQK